MARCRCTNECACAVKAGPSIIITGSGSVSDPWVIAGVPAAAAAVRFVDTAEVDFTVTGAGLPADPFEISATLPLVTISGGTTGDVLTQQPDGSYAPGPPNVVAPGAITTGAGIAGDGSANEPLRICLRTYADLKNAGTC